MRKTKEDKGTLLFHFEDLKKKNNELFNVYIQLRNSYNYIENILGLKLNQNDEAFDTESYNFPVHLDVITKKIINLLNTEKDFNEIRIDTDNERTKLFKDISTLEIQIRQFSNEKISYEKDRTHLVEKVENLEKTFNKSSNLLDNTKSQNNVLEKTILDLQKMNNEQKDEYEKVIKDLNYQLGNCNSTMLNLEKSIKSNEAKIEKKKTKITSLMDQFKEVQSINQKFIHQIHTNENESNQFKTLLEKTLKDYEVSQLELNNKSKILKLNESHLEEFKAGHEKSKKEYIENATIIKELKSQNLSVIISMEHKNEAIQLLENQNKDLKNIEATLREELGKSRKDSKNDLLELRKELSSAQTKIAIYQEKLRTHELELKDHERKDLLSKQQITELSLKCSLNEQDVKYPLKYDNEGSNTIRASEKKLDQIERDKDRSGKKNYETIGSLVEDYKINLKERYRKKVKEYDNVIQYLRTSLTKLFESNQRLSDNEISVEISTSKSIAGNKKLSDHYGALKTLINNIAVKNENNTQLEIDFLKKISEILANKLILSNEDSRSFEEILYNLVSGSMKTKMNIYNLLQNVRNMMLDKISLSKNWPKPVLQTDTLGLKNQNDLIYKLCDISNHIGNLSSHLSEKSVTIKSLLDFLAIIKESLFKLGYVTRSSRSISNCSKDIINQLFLTLESCLINSQQSLISKSSILNILNTQIKNACSNKEETSHKSKNIDSLIFDTVNVGKLSINELKEQLRILDKKICEVPSISPEKYHETVHSGQKSDKKDQGLSKDLSKQIFGFLQELMNEIQG